MSTTWINPKVICIQPQLPELFCPQIARQTDRTQHRSTSTTLAEQRQIS